jgi:hypothetical protein
MVGEADDVQARVVGEAGVPEHLDYLVDSVFQPEAKQNFMVRVHNTNSVRDEQRSCPLRFGLLCLSPAVRHR